MANNADQETGSMAKLRTLLRQFTPRTRRRMVEWAIDHLNQEDQREGKTLRLSDVPASPADTPWPRGDTKALEQLQEQIKHLEAVAQTANWRADTYEHLLPPGREKVVEMVQAVEKKFPVGHPHRYAELGKGLCELFHAPEERLEELRKEGRQQAQATFYACNHEEPIKHGEDNPSWTYYEYCGDCGARRVADKRDPGRPWYFPRLLLNMPKADVSDLPPDAISSDKL